MQNSKSGRLKKPIRDMSFEEQLRALRRDPRFKKLADDVRELSEERRQALQEELQANDTTH